MDLNALPHDFEAEINQGFHRPLRCRIVARLNELGNRPGVLLLLFACVYFVGFGLIAAKAVVSNDELFTLYIARLPHFRDIWAALATGAEQTPPLFYAISRADLHLVGTSGLALRLPELLAFALMCVCVFHIVARRTSAVYGLLALLFPFMTTAFNYVFEARAYALVLAFSALGLLCWIWAVEGRHRQLALIGLATSLAAAISCHYYAVLSLFPLGLGEAIRSFRRKRLDAGIWLALGLSLSPLLMFLPLIQSARRFAPHFWAKPGWLSMAYFYDHFLLTPSAIPLLVIFLAAVIYRALRRPRAEVAERPVPAGVPAHEIAATVGFLLIPVVGVVLAKTVIGAFSERYALPAVVGLAIVVAWGLHSALEARRAPAVALGILLLAFLAIKEVQTYRRVAVDTLRHAQTYSFLESYASGDAPIAISGPMDFMELSYDAPKSLARRLTYLADPRLALQYTGSDDAEKGLVEMRSWGGLNVQQFLEFVASGRRCYVYVINYPDQYGWIVHGLEAAHWRMVLERWQGGMVLFSAAPTDNVHAGEPRKPVAKGAL
ncbi:MAG TPA: glycosyltransferase family 39 protein [Terriglobia bacterium]|nr:glycosyltransferase family 39 protein [Terriglobia bacterium]